MRTLGKDLFDPLYGGLLYAASSFLIEYKDVVITLPKICTSYYAQHIISCAQNIINRLLTVILCVYNTPSSPVAICR